MRNVLSTSGRYASAQVGSCRLSNRAVARFAAADAESAFADLHGLRPVDAVVLPRPSSPRKGREEGKASASVPSKENTNTTTASSVQIANASIARVTDNLFTNINFSSDILTGVRSLPSHKSTCVDCAQSSSARLGLCSASNASLEENSTFKWFKRTLHQFQDSYGAVSL